MMSRLSVSFQFVFILAVVSCCLTSSLADQTNEAAQSRRAALQLTSEVELGERIGHPLGSWPARTKEEENPSKPASDGRKESDAISWTSSGKPLETRTKMDRHPSGCPTKNTLACSGHGKCVDSSMSLWGIKVPKGSPAKICHCNENWFGTACQSTLADYNDKTELRKQLASVLTKASANKTESIADEFKFIPHESFIRSMHEDGTPSHPRLPVNALGDMQSKDGPPAKFGYDLKEWANPEDQELFPGGGMTAQFIRERTEVKINPENANNRNVFESITTRSKMALYTNDKGETIMAPTVYEGQRGIVMERGDTAIHRDSTVQKLINTLNSLHGKKDENGEPMKAWKK